MNKLCCAVLMALALASATAGAAQVNEGTGQAMAQDVVAQLNVVEGNVLVNTGEAFTPADGSMALRAGDIVMTLDGSQAVITDTAGCRLDMSTDSMAVVGTTCTATQVSTTMSNSATSAAVGSEMAPGAVPTAGSAGGAVVAVAALYFTIVIGERPLSRENPVSP